MKRQPAPKASASMTQRLIGFRDLDDANAEQIRRRLEKIDPSRTVKTPDVVRFALSFTASHAWGPKE